jgi:DNA repair exonuclease SbcCD nuclease subunit
MKFAHLADCHIGSWRDPKLNDIATKAFTKAIDLCIEKKVDFIVIAGDLFNTSLPSISHLKQVTKKLKQLKDSNIPAYIIAGSHDFSASGKTMLDVLESADLLINVAKGEEIDNKINLKFTIDKKTGAKIAGLLGKKGMLEKSYYEALNKEPLEKEEGYKIFIFHSLLSEFKPKEFEKVESQPLSLMPKHFDYYAGGHPHFVFQVKEPDYGIIAYPGPLFPNNFRELEKLQRGGFYIVENDKAEWHPIQIHNVFSIEIDADHKTPEHIQKEIEEKILNNEFNNTIVTLRIEGTLSSGNPSDLNFKLIIKQIYDKSAYFVLKNTANLRSKEFEEIKIQAESVEEIENKLVKEHLGQTKISLDEEKLTKELIGLLSAEKQEGETQITFEKRLREELNNVLPS